MELIWEPVQNLGERVPSAPTHDYDNTLKLFYPEGDELLKTEAPTPYGDFDNLTFGNIAAVADSQGYNLLKVVRLMKDYYWFTFTDQENKIWIAPWPHFDPITDFNFTIWVNQYGIWYGDTNVFVNEEGKWYEGNLSL